MKTDLLAEEICRQIKEWIVAFELEPGTPLQESNLARRFGVSRTPVREALRVLKFQGLVEIAPGRGAQVAHVSVGDLKDAYEAREWLEPAAAGKAAKTMDLGVLARLEAALESVPGQVDGREAVAMFERADIEIHDLILQSAGNRIVRSLVGEARMTTRRAEHFVPPGRHVTGQEEHRDIVEALRSRDSDAAEQAMLRHIRASRDRLLAAIGSSNGV